MSKMRDIIIEIQDFLEQGILSYEEISRMTGAPLHWVRELDQELRMESNQE